LQPTICDDVRNIRKYAHIFRDVDLVIADPPYEERDFRVYGQRPLNKAQVIRDLGEVMAPGSYLAWLDVIVPLYSKRHWNLLGHIGSLSRGNGVEAG
jgi:23S rRNA G2445 N2-methylase RlmL